jgi:hypothetical protein
MDIDAQHPKEPNQYLRDAYKKQLTAPDPIEYFRQLTSLDNPKLDMLMGSLKDSISKEDFVSFCSNLADGAAYVRKKFGTQPACIFIIDEADNPMPNGGFADGMTHSIYVTREHIEEGITLEVVRAGKAEPFMLDANQFAFALGVEEAFHVHQMLHYPITAMAHDMMRELHDDITFTSPNYDTLPLEHHAMQVVHQALKERGITDTAPLVISNVPPHKAEWASDILKERSTVEQASQQRRV